MMTETTKINGGDELPTAEELAAAHKARVLKDVDLSRASADALHYLLVTYNFPEVEAEVVKRNGEILLKIAAGLTRPQAEAVVNRKHCNGEFPV